MQTFWVILSTLKSKMNPEFGKKFKASNERGAAGRCIAAATKIIFL